MNLDKLFSRITICLSFGSSLSWLNVVFLHSWSYVFFFTRCSPSGWCSVSSRRFLRKGARELICFVLCHAWLKIYLFYCDWSQTSRLEITFTNYILFLGNIQWCSGLILALNSGFNLGSLEGLYGMLEVKSGLPVQAKHLAPCNISLALILEFWNC